jgi:hypothetical protein
VMRPTANSIHGVQGGRFAISAAELSFRHLGGREAERVWVQCSSPREQGSFIDGAFFFLWVV